MCCTRGRYHVVKLLPADETALYIQAHARRIMDRAHMARGAIDFALPLSDRWAANAKGLTEAISMKASLGLVGDLGNIELVEDAREGHLSA